jgi:hypothetical protein
MVKSERLFCGFVIFSACGTRGALNPAFKLISISITHRERHSTVAKPPHLFSFWQRD